MGRQTLFLLSDADNNDKALVKINHGNNKRKFSYYIKANFYPQSLWKPQRTSGSPVIYRLRAGKAVNVFPDPQIIIRNGILPFAENEVFIICALNVSAYTLPLVRSVGTYTWSKQKK